MAVDYRQQYRPDQLEPFWPNEAMKMGTAVLCTLAVIMVFAILPVVLEVAGLREMVHAEEPADPHGSTPIGIKPEWYFLASYQFLKMMPTELLGISGKTLGVVAQGIAVTVLLLLPFWYRRNAQRRPGWGYRLAVTAAIFAFVGLTVWGGWPAAHGEAGEQLVPVTEYVWGHLVLFLALGLGFLVFYALIGQERRMIRKTLDGPPPPGAEERRP